MLLFNYFGSIKKANLMGNEMEFQFYNLIG